MFTVQSETEIELKLLKHTMLKTFHYLIYMKGYQTQFLFFM